MFARVLSKVFKMSITKSGIQSGVKHCNFLKIFYIEKKNVKKSLSGVYIIVTPYTVAVGKWIKYEIGQVRQSFRKKYLLKSQEI